MCTEFNAFIQQIDSQTPKDPQLPGWAKRVRDAGVHASSKERRDSASLYRFVTAPGFAQNGNVTGAPIQALTDDCNPNAAP